MKPKRLKPSRVVAITLLLVYCFISLAVVMFLSSLNLINDVVAFVLILINLIICMIILFLDNTW